MIAVSVQVHPGAPRATAVRLLPDGSLDVRLRARAVEGQANAGLVSLLADQLGLRRREVVIAHGQRSRQKRRADRASRPPRSLPAALGADVLPMTELNREPRWIAIGETTRVREFTRRDVDRWLEWAATKTPRSSRRTTRPR